MNQDTIDKFLKSYEELLVHDIQLRLIPDSEIESMEGKERFLLTVASALALGPLPRDENLEAEWKRWAYDVATRLAERAPNDNRRFRQAAEIILARLGNFPARDFMRERHRDNDVVHRDPLALAIECLAHEAENTVAFTGLGEKLLTDFQVKLAVSLKRNRPVSVSAPTSAGKSFLLSLDIVGAIAAKLARVIVYVVPTRALIYQVMTDILSKLREAALFDVAVSAAPVPFDQGQVDKGIVYVLTQERLLSLLHSPEVKTSVDALYIDEAQEIGDDDRGMILHSAVQHVINENPKARICFASPLTKNPGFLFNEFEIANNGEFFVEHQSPVAQTLVLLDEIPNDAQAIGVSLLSPIGQKFVVKIETDFKFRGVKERMARTAKLVTLDGETTIVYANRPSDAIEIAQSIAGLLEPNTPAKEVQDLIDFIKSHVHPQYALVDTLPKGVAFHYGKMPHLIRTQIEDLLRSRKLKYVVCTSTLLQGINLPAKNIIIDSPRLGNDRPMQGPQFWNLAGRAGRLRETFNGYIWCINPKKWKENPLAGDRLAEMKSSFRESLEDNKIQEALLEVLNRTIPLHTVVNSGRVEQLFGKIFSEFTARGRSVSKSIYASNADQVRLTAIESKCSELLPQLRVPASVCSRNSIISPFNLDELWGKFQSSNIREMIPVDPVGSDGLPRMRIIFRTIDEVFIKSGTERWKYFVTLAYFWVMGHSLKDMVANYLSFRKVKPIGADINSAIREFLNVLEDDVRFVYVKYLKAYNDVLQEFLTATNQSHLKTSISPLHLYIEYGARDRVLVMLMSLGLSRTTAIFVRGAITNKSEIGRDECWQRLNQLPLNVANIPEVCKREIKTITGK